MIPSLRRRLNSTSGDCFKIPSYRWILEFSLVSRGSKNLQSIGCQVLKNSGDLSVLYCPHVSVYGDCDHTILFSIYSSIRRLPTVFVIRYDQIERSYSLFKGIAFRRSLLPVSYMRPLALFVISVVTSS